MSGIETAAFALGTAVAKAACRIWLGDHQLLAEAGASAIELAAQRMTSSREQRRFRRWWEQAAELVADRVEPLLAHEFRDVPEHERLAAVAAVGDTFQAAALREADLFAHDLDAGYLDRHLRKQDPSRIAVAGLSAGGSALYDLLLRESCAYVIEVVRTLPGADLAGLAEVLRRERQILDDLRTVLARLPARRGVADFARDYRQLVAGVLDQVEFFGATLAESSRRYPLSVAYLSLTVSGNLTIRPLDDGPFDVVDAELLPYDEAEDDEQDPDPAELNPLIGAGSWRPATPARVEDVLASTHRLFLRGEAGTGKTTLLQWIAVQGARGSFPDRLADWNDTVPFLIVLRRHAEGNLPAPEQFVAEVGRHIAAEMPLGWAHEQLRSGKAVVLVDGVDELTEERRDDARQWLQELVATFPRARYVVTTRPAAVPDDWLGRDDFDVAELEPMAATDLPVFVHRWHEAMRQQCDTDDARAELTAYEEQLLAALTAQRHLRGLARYPLLCALLCALHRDRHGQLPGNRMELYEVALQMLLERRDRERRIDRAVALTRTDQGLLLRDLAYWLIRNGWTSAAVERVRDRIATKLTGMAQISASAGEVYRLLLERSGLLREPVAGQVDFVHRSFQEYLAAAEAVATDDIGALVANADTDRWSEVVVMAAGHAGAAQRTELIDGLLARAERQPVRRRADSLRLLAAACLETSPELPPELRQRVQQATASLLPPKTMATAQLLAKSGEFTLELLARTEPRTAAEAAATIRAAADLGDPAALPLLARFGTDGRKAVLRELLRGWPRFDPEQYATRVLAEHPLDRGALEIDDHRLIPALCHLTQLRDLTIGSADLTPLDLTFVRDLPALRELRVSVITDLAPLAGSGLQSFWQTIQITTPGASLPPLSLRPLAEVPDLTDLMIFGRKVTDLSALAGLRQLAWLQLLRLGSQAALAELLGGSSGDLAGLTGLGVGDLPDLISLDALRILTAPNLIYLRRCPHLADVTALSKWAGSLRTLVLQYCPQVDLAPLPADARLELLNLAGSGAVDLAPVARLPRLRRLMVGSGPVPDLAPLRPAPALEELNVPGVAELDVAALAGRERLTITVDRTTTVYGADRLGAGSRVVRR